MKAALGCEPKPTITTHLNFVKLGEVRLGRKITIRLKTWTSSRNVYSASIIRSWYSVIVP